MSALSIVAGSNARAGEFGNIFGNAENQSRQASALALEALSSIFTALKERELKNVELGAKNLMTASQALFAAAEKMKSIKITESENITLEAAGYSQLIVQLPGKPTDLFQLYNIFLAETLQLASLCEKLVKEAPDIATTIMPQLGPQLKNYIEVGDTISRIAAARIKK